MQIYVVEPQDTVDGIANKFGTPVEEIIFANQLIYPYKLAVGQALLVEFRPNQYRTKRVINGYAYPFISNYVLRVTLPYLSGLYIFSYGFTKEGEVVPPALDDQWMINEAYENDTKPVLTLTPFDENGVFSNNLITALVNNKQAIENLIDNLIYLMNEKGFAGLDIDFEYIYKEDRDAFTSFVAECTRRMNEYGIQVSVALAPKTSSDQKGLLYEGKDYGGLGAAANSVLLMTYEWGYTYSSPMAVAPINKVRQVIEYALSQIPMAKIDMGIPNYGYDWTLPYEKGVTKAKTIGNVEAIQLAVNNGATIQYDDVAQTPFFNYTIGNELHEVWFEDVRSINAKLNLINEYNLRGAAYWQIMRLFRANWLLVESKFEVK